MASDEHTKAPAKKSTQEAWDNLRLQEYQPDEAFERFVTDRWQGLSGEARQLAFDAFVRGAVAFAEGLVRIFEMPPVSPLERELAADLRMMVEAYRAR